VCGLRNAGHGGRLVRRVRELRLHPFAVILNRESKRISVTEFWSLVRKLHGLEQSQE
jgi:hypothetical protein